MNNTFYVGLDLGSSNCYQVVMKPDGKIVRSRPIPTFEQNLRSAFSGFEGDLIVHLEAGELANWVSDIIKPLVKQVVVSHPRSLCWIAKDTRKCDKVDARKLADLLRSNLTHEVFLSPNQSRRTFKQLVRHFDEATRAQAKLKAKLKARLRCQGIIRRDSKVFDQRERETVLAQMTDKFLRRMFQGLYATLDLLVEQMKDAKQLMLEAARQFPEIRLLQTAPGIGIIGACRYARLCSKPASVLEQAQVVAILSTWSGASVERRETSCSSAPRPERLRSVEGCFSQSLRGGDALSRRQFV